MKKSEEEQLSPLIQDQKPQDRTEVFGVLDRLPLYVCLLAADHRIVYGNAIFEQLFGPWNDRSCHELLHGNGAPCSMSRTFEALETHQPDRWEWMDSQGRIFLIHNDIFPAQSGPHLILQVGIEITERKVMEEEIHRYQREQARAQALAHIGSWSYDPILNKPTWSEEVFRIFGVDPESGEIPYKKHKNYIHPDDWSSYEQSVAESLKTGKSQTIGFRVIQPNGSVRDAISSWEVELNADGISYRLVGNIQDITDIMNTQRALQESERRYRNILENAAAGIIFCDLDGFVRIINPTAAMFLGGEPFRYQGKSIQHIFEHQVAQEMGARLEATAKSENPLVSEDHLNLPSGEWWFNTTFSRMLDDTDSVIGVQIMLNDITASKLAEQELKTSQEDLRHLADRLETVREEERREIAREIHDNLSQLLTGMRLELAGIEKAAVGNDTINTRVQNMTRVIDHAMSAVHRISMDLRPTMLDDLGFSPSAEYYIENLTQRTGLDIVIKVDGDENRIQQKAATALYRILQEALTNVVRHAEAKKVTVLLSVGDTEANLVIEDDGKGMSEGALRKPTALGVVGMRERALALGGAISFRSKPGSGTRLTVTMPLPNENNDACSPQMLSRQKDASIYGRMI